MALEKKISFDYSITEDGLIQVRQITRIMEDSKELCKYYHRHIVNPGDDTDKENKRVQELAKIFHDNNVIKSYKEKQKV